MGLVGGFIAPAERVVREVDVEAQLGDWVPNVGHLLALADGVRGDERRPYGMGAHELRRLDEPAGDVVDVADVLGARRECVLDLGFLFAVLIAGAQERRVADDVIAVLRCDDLRPIHAQGIAVVDVGGIH